MDDPQTSEDRAAYWVRVAQGERERITTLQGLEEHLMATLANKQLTATYELPVLGWLSIIDEIKNRHPTGFMTLLRDDMFDRLNAAIDRVHEEVNYMVAVGPSPSVAARHADQRGVRGRQSASPELQRLVAERPEE